MVYQGWTLQELIAPPNLTFYTKDWHFIGTRSDLSVEICKITKIDRAILCQARPLITLSVAKRMSWAADRTTTRPEDISYSLLGLFDVNMSLLYGEGQTNAFLVYRKRL